MRYAAILLLAGLAGHPAWATEPVEVTRLLSTTVTASGQPIILPQHDARVVVSRFVIQPGVTLPVHEHMAQRYAYVESGRLRVTLSDSDRSIDYAAGDFIVEVRDQWHYGTALGSEPVVLVVIDQTEGGEANTVLRQQAK